MFSSFLLMVMPKGRGREVVESWNPTEEFSSVAFRRGDQRSFLNVLKLFGGGRGDAEG
jgi:hypothetical protein